MLFYTFILSCFSLKLPIYRFRMKESGYRNLPLGDYIIDTLDTYKVTNVSKICILESLENKLPNMTFNLLVYRDPRIPLLKPSELDSLVLRAQDRLDPLGVFILDTQRDRVNPAYSKILEYPQELWDYNLVSPLVNGTRISCRKGSSLVSKERTLRRMQIYVPKEYKLEFINLSDNFIINTLGIIVLFNFFAFGLMLLLIHSDPSS